MVSICRDHLKNTLKNSGIKSKVFISEKALKRTSEKHVGAVLFEKEEFRRNGSKKVYEIDGKKYRRTKVFDRTTVFSVVIGEYNIEKLESIFNKFMAGIGRGIEINGNFVEIVVKDSEWFSEDDSVLSSSEAVQILIQFEGGIYEDVTLEALKGISIEGV